MNMKEILKIGSSPFLTVLEVDGIALNHYPSNSNPGKSTPILIIPSIINKNYILDLLPRHSLIEFFNQQGLDIYLIDWKSSISSDPFIKFADLIFNYIDSFVNFIIDKHAASAISIIGHCLGGTMGLLYASQKSNKIKNLQLITAPADFDQSGVLGQWAQTTPLDLNLFNEGYGKAPAWLLQTVFQLARPASLLFKIKKLTHKMHDPEFINFFLALEYWGWDVADLSPSLYKELIHNFYQNNQLIRNKFKIGGYPCQLNQVTCPISVVSVEDDHIVPLTAQLKSHHVPMAPYRIQILRGGHIGGTLGFYAQKNHWLGWAQHHQTQEMLPCHTFL